ncbi:MAG: hypothetical protein AVDCRST_MAG02-3050, partial [uncultured Rubrobacteraceae bacterium]
GEYRDDLLGPAHARPRGRGRRPEPLRGIGPGEGYRRGRGPVVRAARRDGVRHRLRLRAGEPRRGRAAPYGDGPLRRVDLGPARTGRPPGLRGGGRGHRGRGRGHPGAAAPAAGGAAHGPLPHPARGDGHRERHEHGQPDAYQDPGRPRAGTAGGGGGPGARGHEPPGRRPGPEDRAPARHDPAHRLDEDGRHRLPAGRDGRHDHRRRRPAGGRPPADSRPLHAARQRLRVRHTRRPTLLPLLFYQAAPAPGREARRRAAGRPAGGL